MNLPFYNIHWPLFRTSGIVSLNFSLTELPTYLPPLNFKSGARGLSETRSQRDREGLNVLTVAFSFLN